MPKQTYNYNFEMQISKHRRVHVLAAVLVVLSVT